MLKDGNNKANISRVLLRKQVLDCVVLFVVFELLFCCVKFLHFDGLELTFALAAGYLILCAFFEVSRNAIKRPINNIVLSAVEQTEGEINSIHEKNNAQKENNVISDNKIRNISSLIRKLKEYSLHTKELTLSIHEKTSKSLDFTNNEHTSVKSNIEKMFSIRHKIQTIAELILELSDFVQSISSTIGLVEDIAEQTNLLALNAAVEAARAGEHGKGFAVVASEIRKLADESKQATAKITSLINDIQQTANSTVLATEEGTKEIESGLELAHLISDNIEHLINSMNEISDEMNSIISSSDDISQDIKEVDEGIDEFSKIVESNKKLASEKDELFEKIEEASNAIKRSVI